MKRSAAKVLGYLAGNENIEATTLSDLQKLVDENPYFPVAHFLLAKKLKVAKSDSFIKQSQKTALYFSNPYWLHYQLADTSLQENFSANEKLGSDGTIEAVKLRADEDPPVDRDTSLNPQPLEAKTDEKEVEINNEEVSKPIGYNNLDNDIAITQAEEEMADLARETDPSATAFLDELKTSDETFTRDNIDKVILETQAPADFEVTEVIEEMAGASRETDETTEEFLQDATLRLSQEADEYLDKNVNKSGEKVDIQEERENNENEIVGDLKSEPDEHERMFQNIKAMLDATNEEADADVSDAVVTIDPYYTIDYFASQGIKLELEKDPKDQLGQNLKKFTQWLRHMKKLGPEDATEVITRTDKEADIQKIAETSNTVREVVTEAMASVLEKQGKNDKAIELYKKLSFLNPDKSTYFAAKIKNLKGI